MSERAKHIGAALSLLVLMGLGGYVVYMQPAPIPVHAPTELAPLTDAEFAALKEQLRADLRAAVVQDGVQGAPKSDACKCGAPACPCAGPLEPPGDDPQPTPAPGLHVNITSEKAAYAPGETVELRADGSAKGWAWWSASPHKVYEDAKVCVFSTATPGDYVFILAGFSDAHPVPLIAAHTVHIEGTPPAPTPPGPGPKPPEPAPPKQLSDLVREWTLKVNRPSEAAKLANVYDGVAWKINHGLTDPAEILKLTADGSRAALGVNVSFWKAWAESLRAELNARDAKAPLDYAATWREIAGGLMATIPTAKATVGK